MSTISWYQYLIAVALIAGIYYIGLAASLFKGELKQILRRRSGRWEEAEEQMEEEGHEEKESEENRYLESEEAYTGEFTNSDEQAAYEELETVVANLKSSILEAGKEVSKDQLLELFKETLADFSGLRNPAYQEAVNDLIIEGVKKNCGVVFSEEELNAAWETLPR